MPNVHVVQDVEEVRSSLACMGLDEAVLAEALRQANLYRVRLTPHHPRLYTYQVMSGETVAALRDLLIPRGWTKSDDGNYELTVNDDHTIAIAVASGDEGTGFPHRTPANKSPKGRHTADAVEANRQTDMFPELLPPAPTAKKKKPVETWVLLHHVTPNEIRAELSKPREMDDVGKIIDWSKRILLGNIPLDGDLVKIDPPQQPDLDIVVTRKSA